MLFFEGDFGGENVGPCANVACCGDCESAWPCAEDMLLWTDGRNQAELTTFDVCGQGRNGGLVMGMAK